MSKVWYITGASQVFGLSLVKKPLAAGHRVAATSRNVQVLKNAADSILIDLKTHAATEGKKGREPI